MKARAPCTFAQLLLTQGLLWNKELCVEGGGTLSWLRGAGLPALGCPFITGKVTALIPGSLPPDLTSLVWSVMQAREAPSSPGITPVGRGGGTHSGREGALELARLGAVAGSGDKGFPRPWGKQGPAETGTVVRGDTGTLRESCRFFILLQPKTCD